MTVLLDEAIEKLRRLAPSEQDYVADVLLDYTDQDGDLRLTPAQTEEVRRRLDDAQPHFATLAEVTHRFVRRVA